MTGPAAGGDLPAVATLQDGRGPRTRSPMRRLAWFSLVPGLAWFLLPAVFSGHLGPADGPVWVLPVIVLVGLGFVVLWRGRDLSELPVRLLPLWVASGLTVSVYGQPRDLLGLAAAFAFATPLALFWIGLPLLAESTVRQVLDHHRHLP